VTTLCPYKKFATSQRERGLLPLKTPGKKEETRFSRCVDASGCSGGGEGGERESDERKYKGTGPARVASYLGEDFKRGGGEKEQKKRPREEFNGREKKNINANLTRTGRREK